MTPAMRIIACVLLLTAPVAAASQVALDRIVTRVAGRIVTESDIRQARLLQLVGEADADAAVQRALENRILMLAEIARMPSLPPTTDAALRQHRAAWERRMGGPDRARQSLAEVAMDEASLDAWFRDDLRIEAHLARQFGGVPEADRARAVRDWVTRLRARAGLS